MIEKTPLQRLADKLAAKLGDNYTVESDNLNIYVFVPDSDYNRAKKFMEFRGYLSKMNDEGINALNLEVRYNDEDKVNRAPHRILVDTLQKLLKSSIKIAYHANTIQITLPDDNNNAFVKDALLIMKSLRQLVIEQSVIFNEPLNIRFKRSYRELNFKIGSDNVIELVPICILSTLELEILYQLSNLALATNQVLNAPSFGFGDSEFGSALHNLEAAGFIQTDFDFLAGGFFNEREISNVHYPASYVVKLIDDKITRYLKEN